MEPGPDAPALDRRIHGVIDADFDVDDLVVAVDARVDRTVVVQSACTMAETELLLNVAAETPLIGAVVGWVDLTAPNRMPVVRQI